MTKVLIVDDERDIRELLADDLSDSGYQVVEATNGAEALDVVSNERPDIVLLDLMMPVMDGTQALNHLRADPVTADIPVVLLTAVSADEGEQKATELGADQYVTKPWAPGAIQAVIEMTLNGISEGRSGLDETGGENIEAATFTKNGDV